MFIPWKSCSFWLDVCAWLAAAAGVILFLTGLREHGAAFYWLGYAAGGFLSCKTFALFARAAERYLGIEETKPEEEEEE